MQRRNNYDKNVFNGDVGTIQRIDKEEQIVVVDYPEGPGRVRLRRDRRTEPRQRTNDA